MNAMVLVAIMAIAKWGQEPSPERVRGAGEPAFLEKDIVRVTCGEAKGKAGVVSDILDEDQMIYSVSFREACTTESSGFCVHELNVSEECLVIARDLMIFAGKLKK